MNEKRVNEIISRITAFSKDTCTRSEFLPELLKLQKQLIDLTFNTEHAENSDLRLWDVESHLSKLNEKRGHVADAELDRFKKGSKVVCNNIKAEISGRKGEHKVFRSLENIDCENEVLHNVELEFDGRRAEIDAIVFTNYAIFIIEIKNSKKDIFIDEDGEFYRLGNSMHHDCNIADKMDEREALLRKALEKVGLDHLKIFKIVTFTNPRIDVENKYHCIKVCGSNYLPTFIGRFKSDNWYTHEDIYAMIDAVNEARCPDEYEMPIDMDDYKRDFALLMTKLESADDVKSGTDASDNTYNKAVEKPEDSDDNEKEVNDKMKSKHKYGKAIAIILAGAVLVNVVLIAGNRILRKREITGDERY